MALSVEENPYLQDIVYRYMETRDGNHPIPLWCFYETKPSPVHKVYNDDSLQDVSQIFSLVNITHIYSIIG